MGVATKSSWKVRIRSVVYFHTHATRYSGININQNPIMLHNLPRISRLVYNLPETWIKRAKSILFDVIFDVNYQTGVYYGV